MIAPPAGDDPHLLKAVEDFAVEQFISQTGIEAFDIAVLPWAAGLDIEGNDAKPAESLAHRISDELGAVIGSDMLGRPMLDEQIGQHVNHVVRPEAPQRHHRQAFPAELVDNVEHSELATVVRLILDEVVGPHMPRCSGRSRMHDPSPSQSRRRFGCRFGTLRPSRRQIRSTTDRLTCQPAWPSKTWMRR